MVSTAYYQTSIKMIIKWEKLFLKLFLNDGRDKELSPESQYDQ